MAEPLARESNLVMRSTALPSNHSTGAQNYQDTIGSEQGAGLLGPYNESDDDEDRAINPALRAILRKRSQAILIRSRKQSEYWAKTEALITALLLGEDIEACSCNSRASMSVRHIGVTSYDTKLVNYCNCSHGAASAATLGFFPSRPIRPGTIFAIELLEQLQEQLQLRTTSIHGWCKELRASIEKQLGTAVPSFEKTVGVHPLSSLGLLL